ncbi:MAG: cytochrome ubiquinol oxidase subunit I [Polyangiaceae bacterium]
MHVDATVLHRIQFALTIMFHYLFPPLSIGLGLLLVAMEGAFLRTKDPVWERMARFWTRIFAVNFAMGVATGLVMEFQFGTNWSTYSRFVGDVFGSALAAEGIFAFFLESGFLAVLVFGWERVSPRMHFFATVMVFVGSVFSSVWIIVANSFQQTPAGHLVTGTGVERRAEIVDFWAMVFSPSSMPRLVHTLLGAFILGAFFVMSVSAWHVLKGRSVALSKKAFALALAVGTLASWAEVVAGDVSAKVVAVHQPAKLAAFEGHFKTETTGTPLYLVGLPDAEREEMRFGIAVPKLLSLMVHHDPDVPVQGLDRTPRDERPPVLPVFASYHVMIGLGTFFVGFTSLLAWFVIRGTLWSKTWLLRASVVAVVLPYVANEAGWISAEVGRQPWVVYGLLRTRDAISRSVPSSHVWASMVLFALVYALLFAVWVFVLHTKITHGPEADPGSGDEGRPSEGSRSLIETAALLVDPAGASLSDVRAASPGAVPSKGGS